MAWRYDGKFKSSSGQAPVLAIIFFLLLIPTSVIIAENATNNLTGNAINEFPNENSSENEPDANLSTEVAGENISIPSANASEIISPLNITISTIPENGTSHANDTVLINITPVILPEPTNEPPDEPSGPVLSVNLEVPRKATRQEAFTVSYEITNTGDSDASEVEVEWILPDGLEIVEGALLLTCDVLVGGSCRSELTLIAPPDTQFGKHEIKVLVRYLD